MAADNIVIVFVFCAGWVAQTCSGTVDALDIDSCFIGNLYFVQPWQSPRLIENVMQLKTWPYNNVSSSSFTFFFFKKRLNLYCKNYVANMELNSFIKMINNEV